MNEPDAGAEVRPIRDPWDQKLDELRQEHAEVIELEAGEVRIAVRPPKPLEYERFVDTITDDRKGPKNVSACRGLLKSCLLHPTWNELYEGPLTRRPGLITSFGQALAKEAGAGVEVEVKKA